MSLKHNVSYDQRMYTHDCMCDPNDRADSHDSSGNNDMIRSHQLLPTK